MPVKRLNHAVLYVRDVHRTVEFYEDALGFRVVMQFPGAAFLKVPDSRNDHDLGLFELGPGAGPSEAGQRTVGLYHLAWEVETLGELQEVGQRLGRLGALVGASDHGTTKALYAKDPDGIEFEVSWLVPAELIDEELQQARTTVRPLNLPAEIERYGADRPGLQTVVYDGRDPSPRAAT
ncbi:MAG: VOC family protein [Acidimicrobiia bacterium]|nr:VOC family protein [Acidimicrobiia bacterium]